MELASAALPAHSHSSKMLYEYGLLRERSKVVREESLQQHWYGWTVAGLLSREGWAGKGAGCSHAYNRSQSVGGSAMKDV